VLRFLLILSQGLLLSAAFFTLSVFPWLRYAYHGLLMSPAFSRQTCLRNIEYGIIILSFAYAFFANSTTRQQAYLLADLSISNDSLYSLYLFFISHSMPIPPSLGEGLGLGFSA